MRNSLRHAAVLLVLVLVAAPGARAVVLDGMYTVDFTGPQSIWPLDEIDVCESGSAQGVDIDVCVDMTFAYDGGGGVTGSGSFEFTITGLGLNIEATLMGVIKGKSKGSDTKGIKHNASFKFVGPVAIQGVGDVDATASGKLNTYISTTGMAETNGSIKLSLKGLGSASEKLEPPIFEQLASGDWTAKLTVTPDPDGKTLAGTVDFTLPGGGMVQIPLSGKYNAKNDESSLKAKGDKADPAQKGLSLGVKKATSTGPGDIAGEAGGKVQGLKIKVPVGP